MKMFRIRHNENRYEVEHYIGWKYFGFWCMLRGDGDGWFFAMSYANYEHALIMLDDSIARHRHKVLSRARAHNVLVYA